MHWPARYDVNRILITSAEFIGQNATASFLFFFGKAVLAVLGLFF
jgi:hypothetical protein